MLGAVIWFICIIIVGEKVIEKRGNADLGVLCLASQSCVDES